MPLFVFIFLLLGCSSAHAQERYQDDPVAPFMMQAEDIALMRHHDPLESYNHMPQQALPHFPAYPQDTTALINNQNIRVVNEHPSRIESYYATRIIDTLPQFGYELFFGTPADRDEAFTTLPTGAVQDNFVLNIGDELSVTTRGQHNAQKTYKINNDGLLILDNLPPVPAAGRSLAQLHSALKALTASNPNVDLYLSLAKVRQINVLVIGHILRPGGQNMTVFHTVLDALSDAGGIRKDGSLRRIKLIRNGRTHLIDLYSLLIHGSDNGDITLRDGDRLVIPPIGPTVAISGAVKRPGIYEIRRMLRGMNHLPGQTSEALSLQEVLDMAGGVLAPGQNRFVKLTLTPEGEELVSEISDPFAPQFTDGTILDVAPTDERRAGQVELAGHTRKEGLHALTLTPTLSALLENDQVLGPDIYPLIGVIERWNNEQMARQHLVFPLDLVIKGAFDQRLQDGDIIHLFLNAQIRNLNKPLTQAGSIKNNIELISLGSQISADDPPYIQDPILSSMLKEYMVYLKGAVRAPGGYPVAEGATLEGILAVAGGLTLEANHNRIEVTSSANTRQGEGARRLKVNLNDTNAMQVSLTPGDTIRVNQTGRKLNNESVILQGEVLQPGEYNLMPGDTLSSLLARAGGLSPEAYPEGAIFSRARERKAEEQRFRAAARDMERAVAIAIDQDGKGKPDTQQIALAKDLAAELRDVEAVGRITIEAAPDKLLSNPELDLLMEPGDRIYIPKRPYTVRVRGEVLSPANLQFRSGKSSKDYLMEAGGYTHFADKERIFVIYPDGSAQPL